MYRKIVQILIGITLVSIMMSCGSGKEKSPECYKDEYFCAMLVDSMAVVEEDSLLGYDALDFNSSRRMSLICSQQLENDSMVRDMADLYNFCELLEAMYIDHESYIRYIDDDLGDDLLEEWYKVKCPTTKSVSVRDSLTGDCSIIDCPVVFDTMVRRRISEICEAHIDSFIAGTLGSNEECDERLIVSDIVNKIEWWYPDCMSDIEYDTILAHLSPNAYLPADFPDIYETFVGESAEPSEKDLNKLTELYKNTTDYDEKLACAFTMLGIWGYEAHDSLLFDSEIFFESGIYSPMLPLLWRAYRIKYCDEYTCPSTFCYVPNLRFNYYRRLIAYTYLCHIHNHPDDNWAKLQYYYLCHENNIRKFGEYNMGNQSAAEYIYLFWNKSVL